MSPPWERYAAPAAAAPWERYAAPESEGIQDFEPRQFTTGEKVSRVIGQGAQGFNDTLANIAGAPVDAVAWGLRKAGLSVTDPVGGSESIKRGLDYVATLPGRAVDAVSSGSAAPLVDDRTSRFDAAGTLEKAAHGTGEGVANTLAVMLPAGVVANTARGTTQGVANVLRSQPVAQTVAGAAGGAVGEATDNPLLGLAASVAVPVGAAGARRAITPITNQLSPQGQRLATAAENESINLTAGQRTGSPGLLTVESALSKLPGSSGTMRGVLNEQRGDFNQAVLRRAGVDAREASPEVVDRAFRNAGQTFDDLASRTVLNADPQFARDVARVGQDYGRRLPTDVAPVFNSYMEDLAPLVQAASTPGANPQVAGQTYQAIRSDITTRIRGAKDPDLRRALGGLVEAMDDAMERSTSGALRHEWQDARREYQALMTVDRAMQGGRQADRVDANIPFASLRQAAMSGDRAGYSRGRGQLNELSRVGDFLADKVPDSGTPTRSMLSNPLLWPMIPVNALGARVYTSAPVQNYLSNNLMGRTDFPAHLAGIAAREGVSETTDTNAMRRRGAR